MEDDKLEKNNEQAEATDEKQEQKQSEEQKSDEQVEDLEGQQPAEGEEQAEEKKEEEKPSPRRDKRIKELLDRLQQKPDEPTAKKTGLNYRDALDADDETIKQLETDREAYGKNLYEQGVQQANSIQFHTRLELDTPKIESRYPQLDPRSPEFDQETLTDLNDLYLHLVGYDFAARTVKTANLRYADFVDNQMALADRLASKRNTESVKNIAKQASQTGLRPDGTSPKRLDLTKSPEQMTDEELDAVINQDIPPKTRRR
jgi:hypothetical protein